MPDPRDLRLDLSIDRYMDELVLGEAASADPEALDPGLAATVRRVQALNWAPKAELRFADRLWNDLMIPYGAAGDRQWSPRPEPLKSSRSVAPLPLPPSGPLPVPANRRRWALTQLATAALLVLTLALGAFASRQAHQEGRDGPTWLPAVLGGPLPAGFTEETVFVASFAADELPEGQRTAILYYVTLAPGASLPYLVAPTCDFHCVDRALDYGVSPGVGAELVQSGLYSVRLAAPVQVQRRASAGGKIELIEQGEVTLGPGDAAIYHNRAAPAELRNSDLEPVVLFGVAIVGDVAAEDRLRLPPGVEQGMLANTIPADWETLPSGPLQVTVRRVTLPAGTSLPPYEPVGLEAIRVESGAIAWTSMRPGQDEPGNARIAQRTGATTPFMAAPPGARRVLHSVGDEPVVMLVVTIEPASISPQSLMP